MPSAVLGTLGGLTLGRFVLRIYGTVFGFPDLSFELPVSLLGFALLVSAGAATLGAFFVRREKRDQAAAS